MVDIWRFTKVYQTQSREADGASYTFDAWSKMCQEYTNVPVPVTDNWFNNLIDFIFVFIGKEQNIIS